MGRVSFLTRRNASDGFSTLRYDPSLPPGALSDFDSALRADDLQIAPLDASVFVEGVFQTAAAQCYGEVNLGWSLPLTAVEDLSTTPEATHALLVYSDVGYPQTIASGRVLVDAPDVFAYNHTGLPEGKWAYYSLFVRYQSTTGDDYYEKVASLSELVVKNYGSTLMLWNRIPEFYRRLDARDGDYNYDERCLGFPTYSEPVGPLLKFLSIVGFEVDKTRTLIDYQMVSRDPQLSNAESLDALSEELGTVVREHDLGTKRLRLLMDSIGAFRRAKGTEDGTTFFLESLSGGNISIDSSAREITLYSQRANLMPDPQNGKTVDDYIDWRPADWDELLFPEDTTFADRDPQDTPSVDELERVSSRWKFVDGHDDRTDEISGYPAAVSELEYPYTGFAGTPPGGAAAEDLLVGVLLRITSPVTVAVGDTLSVSVHSGIGTANMAWARLVDSSTGEVEAVSLYGANRHGSRYFDILVEESGDVYVELLVDLRSGPFQDTHFLVEKNYAGPYFDGSTKRGGWLTGVSNISDFRWASTPHDSVSLYHEEYERTKQIVDQFLEEVLPIDVASTYSIVDYDAVL